MGRGRGGGSGRVEKVEKGEGRLELDICPRAPDLLVMPLVSFTLKIA